MTKRDLINRIEAMPVPDDTPVHIGVWANDTMLSCDPTDVNVEVDDISLWIDCEQT